MYNNKVMIIKSIPSDEVRRLHRRIRRYQDRLYTALALIEVALEDGEFQHPDCVERTLDYIAAQGRKR